MTRDRFQLLFRRVRIFDAALITAPTRPTPGGRGRDPRKSRMPKVYKQINEWSAHIQETGDRFLRPGSDITVDEAMVRFTGRSMETTTIPTKPIPQGFKLVVTSLLALLPLANYHAFLDNLFASVKLFRALRDQKIGATGTCRKDGGIDKTLVAEKETEGRGIPLGQPHPISTADGQVNQFTWKDNALVLFLTTVFDETSEVVRNRRRPAGNTAAKKAAREVFSWVAANTCGDSGVGGFRAHVVRSVAFNEKGFILSTILASLSARTSEFLTLTVHVPVLSLALLACQGLGHTITTEDVPILWEIDVSMANPNVSTTSFAVMSSTPDGCRFLNFAAALIAFVKNEDGAKALALLMAAPVSDTEQRVPSSAHLTMILEALVKYLPQNRNEDLASRYSAAARHQSDPEAVDTASWIRGWVVRNHNNTHDIIQDDISALRRQIGAFQHWCLRPE
ncbi:uncharacterized protein CCOS01_16949 [Colletotrichum costaricense]|uniref:PiggyBac transposable element-derived protein domain-containing protein n=2 Tax=Colletotrichum acutatum species complex TaxID=2707335 RepID=A0AAI9YEH6_9PEZI|nr:uncharacterized protein CCOS01_16949 [Colletotrichum costaricense]KAK1503874.1 hypothetical protein CCOS01_16949 [Colletotrichum costaricense]